MSIDRIKTALKAYLPYRGDKYINPSKAGPLAEDMLSLRQKGQEARAAFTELAQALAEQVPSFQLERTSQWMNQAQLLRPHFWAYYREDGVGADRPSLALRLLNDCPGLGLSLEVSCLERHKSDATLDWQNQVLSLSPQADLYYLVQETGLNQRWPMSEQERQLLLEKVQSGEVRKVQVKFDIPDLSAYQDLKDLIGELKRGWDLLLPFYMATQPKKEEKIR